MRLTVTNSTFIVTMLLLCFIIMCCSCQEASTPFIKQAHAADVPTATFITAAENQTDVTGADPNGTLIVDFSAHWCEPCKMDQPYVRNFAAAHGWTFVLLNTDLPITRPLMDAYGINSMPTYLVFSNGKLIEKFQFGMYNNRETSDQAETRINARLTKTAALIKH